MNEHHQQQLRSQLLNNCETCHQIINNNDISVTSSDYSSECDYSQELRLNLDGTSRSKLLVVPQQQQQQPNKTFSSEKVREIERTNAMLVNRILSHSRRPNQYKLAEARLPVATSSEINRRRRQEKISRENEILLKKIQSVKPAVRY